MEHLPNIREHVTNLQTALENLNMSHVSHALILADNFTSPHVTRMANLTRIPREAIYFTGFVGIMFGGFCWMTFCSMVFFLIFLNFLHVLRTPCIPWIARLLQDRCNV